jgi:hypothetical protein
LLLDTIANIPVDDNYDRDDFRVEEIPVLVRADILHVAAGVIVNPLRRVDLAGTFVIPPWRRAVCGGRPCRSSGGRDTLSIRSDNARCTYVARGNRSRNRSAIVDGDILGSPLSNDSLILVRPTRYF